MLAFDPADHSPGDIYKLMVGAIVPRPIALVSSVDEANVRNLAPFSYFTACSSNPPVVVFCPILRPLPPTAKDTLRNIMATREFVVNIVSEEFVERMNATAATVGPEVDEFALSGLTPIASDLIKPADLPKTGRAGAGRSAGRGPSMPGMFRRLRTLSVINSWVLGALHDERSGQSTLYPRERVIHD